MFGNQLEMLSLLLLGLSLSSNLSEAVPNRRELLQFISHATDHDELKTAFLILGGPFKEYAELTEVTLNNCTPKRILFPNTLNNYLGEGARDYVTYWVGKQREVCELTFFDRLLWRYADYLDDWRGKEYFQQYVNFIEPWPIFGMDWNVFKQSVRGNIQKYIDWRETQSPKPSDRNQVLFWLIASNNYVYRSLSGFYASMRANEDFQPVLSFEHAHAVALGMIAEATELLVG